MTSGTIESDVIGVKDIEFQPAWWLPGGHAQTLWRKFSPAPAVPHVRERVELQDGDFIDLDWAGGTSHGEQAGETVVLILHGLCGCSRSPYVRTLQAVLAGQSVSSVAMNFRGCSGEVNRLAKAYHSGISADVDEVFTHLLARLPGRRFVCVGYSLGANVLLKWLGEAGAGANSGAVRRAVAVSTPFELAACSRAMLKGMGRVYGRYFVKRLVNDFKAKKAHFTRRGETGQLALLEKLSDTDDIADIWQFDDRITAPLHGFVDAADYYGQCSSKQYLERIATDTLLIQSANDPLIPASALPRPERLPGNISLRLSSGGGHVGFIGGARSRWLEKCISGFLLGSD